MHRSSCCRLRSSTGPNVLMFTASSSSESVWSQDTGQFEPPSVRFAGARLATRPRCRSLREESSLCARVRNPVLFHLSYGGDGAGGGSRTRMGRGPPASEAGAYACFATPPGPDGSADLSAGALLLAPNLGLPLAWFSGSNSRRGLSYVRG